MTDKYYYEHNASEAEWLNWFNSIETKSYQNTQSTIDLLIVKFIGDELKVLVNRRDIHPFKNQLALPGTYIHDDEKNDLETIARLYKTKLATNMNKTRPVIQQLATYSDAGRDPRGRVVSIAYIVYDQNIEAHNGYEWVSMQELIEYTNLAFDHQEIIYDAFTRIKDQFSWKPFVLNALPEKFSLTDLVKLKANLYSQDYKLINRANLRKKMLQFIKKDSTKNNTTYYKTIIT